MLSPSIPSALLPSALLLLLLAPSSSLAQAALPTTTAGLISTYSLTNSATLSQPSKKLTSSNKTDEYLIANWDLNKNRIQAGTLDLTFVDDPYDTSSSDAVLAVNYVKGSYGGSGDGGAQFYSTPLDNSSYGSMLLSYEIAFSEGFAFNKGGKLPGLRGGDAAGCSGGTAANGTTCYSARLMFRESGAGEVYAYIPTPNNICSSPSTEIICNSDYGSSLSRGSFTFTPGNWSKVDLFVQLNNPINVANGRILMFYNDALVMTHTNLQIRAADVVLNGGMFFSTFFGGSDSSWQSPQNQSSYFRNIKLYGGTPLSDGAGATVTTTSASGSSPRAAVLAQGGLAIGLASLIAFAFVW